jgi:hypothetical protein
MKELQRGIQLVKTKLIHSQPRQKGLTVLPMPQIMESRDLLVATAMIQLPVKSDLKSSSASYRQNRC